MEENINFPPPLIFYELIEVLKRFVCLPDPRYYLLLAVYCFLTHIYYIFERIPHLLIIGSGDGRESTVGEILSLFCRNSRLINHFTQNLTYQLIKQGAPTLITDISGLKSIDQNPALSQLICNSSKKSGSDIVYNDGGKIKTASTYCPIVLTASEERNWSAVFNKFIKVEVKKSPVPLERFFFSQARKEFKKIKIWIKKFCQGNKTAIEKEYHNFSRIEGLSGFDEAFWMTILSIAKVLDQSMNKTNFLFDRLLSLAKDTIRARVKEKFLNNVESQCLVSTLGYIKKNAPLKNGFYLAEAICGHICIQWELHIQTKMVGQILNKYHVIQRSKVSWFKVNDGKEKDELKNGEGKDESNQKVKLKSVQKTCWLINNQALHEALADILNLVD